MSQKEIIILRPKELKRLKIIQEVINKHITQKQASSLLALSQRQIANLVKRIREEGDKGIIHRLRSKPSHRAFPQKLKDKVINLYKKKYHDFGPTLATEKLLELDSIKLSRETLRKWLISEGLWIRKRKLRKHRFWRPRCECFGQMVQLDGSHHKWLEDRGPELVLMTYVDDATNKVFARFYDYEGTIPAMDSFKRYLQKYGVPQTIYVDKHTTYRSYAKQTIEEQLQNRMPQSQFERALDELGINLIHASSPQAKGRVERTLRTFQDRLIKEMRLKNIRTKEQANNFLRWYLPRFNERFSIEPINPTNLHRPIPKTIDLDKIFSIKTKRALRSDFTIRHNKRLYQILDMPKGVRTKYVFVEERLNGKLYINYNGFALKYKLINVKPPKPEKPYKPKNKYIPPKDHPWRKFKLPGSLNFEEKEETLVGAF